MEKQIVEEWDPEEFVYETPSKLNPEMYPSMFNISAVFFFQFTPVPKEIRTPEFVYIPLPKKRHTRTEIAICDWNLMWEAGHLRPHGVIQIPRNLKWLTKFEDTNIYLLPGTPTRYEAYSVLFHLLPQKTIERFGLRPMKHHVWPPGLRNFHVSEVLPQDFTGRLAKAFAWHVWPLLNNRSKIRAFSKDDPLVILSHNLDYWLPFAYMMAENRLRSCGRVKLDDAEQGKKLKEIRQRMPEGVKAERPRGGGPLWTGEEEAWEALTEVVQEADRHGKLRSIIDAVMSNRIEDDFSPQWSYEREDFERKLYKKRMKVKVSFVQLDETIPVHGRDSEIHEDLLWEDFFALLNKKERSITVCLRNGFTKAGEISKILGYANHSPVSKALKRIREKARRLFDLPPAHDNCQ